AKLFRHTGYESILEGEITETGVGFVMRRQLQSLKGLFRNPFGRNRYRKKQLPADSTEHKQKALSRDSIIPKEEKDNGNN
ncbi:MAG: hypothetical protein K2M67_01470, partial [Muribaculaceae bacterium]|nr:hypothetical protein [Muribaculaceae bacterium]